MSGRDTRIAGGVFVLLVLAIGGPLGCDQGGAKIEVTADAGQLDQMVDPDVGMPQPDATPPADGPLTPPAIPTGMSVPANPSPVALGPLDRWATLRDGRVVSQSGAVFSLYAARENAQTAEADGELLSAVLLEDTVLVLTTEGLYSWTDLGLEVSPLDETISAPFEALEGQSQQGWFVGSAGLTHWTGGMLRTLNTGDLVIPWERALMAAGTFRGLPALWVAFDQTLLAIVAGAEASSWRFELHDVVKQVAATANGLYLLFSDRLTHFGDDESWTVWTRPEGASLIGGHVDAPDLWISNGVSLWQVTEGELRERTGNPVHAGLRVSAAGDAYLKSADAIHRVVAGRFITFTGLEPDARLVATTTITVEATTPDQVQEISYRLDDNASVVLDGTEWSIVLDPAELASGPHALSVEIRYDDGAVLGASFTFLGPPSWVADIGPLNDTKCAGCHGEGGSAHMMDDAESWRLEIAEIVDDVETGRMPYGNPMLPAEEIDLIRAWRDTGMRQGQATP